LEELKTELRQEMHRDFVNMHRDMIVGFSTLRDDVLRALSESLKTVDEVVKENTELKEEIRRLKHLY